MEEKCVQSAEGETKLNTLAVVKLIFQSAILRKHILIMALFWLSVTVTYYAITFFVPNLGGNRHTNIMMGGAVEIAGYFVLFFAMNRYGRSRVLGIFAISSALLCAVFAVTELIENIDTSTRGRVDYLTLELIILTYTHLPLDTLGIVVMLLAKAFAISAFCGMYIITGELFPTICRGTTFGICGFWSRVGSLIAPQIVSATEVVTPALPMFLLGGLLAFSGALMFLLPETLKIQIPNTMEDVEELWGKEQRRKDKEAHVN